MKKGPFQWRTSVTVRAPKPRVWAIVNDISLIPKYHPEVRHVELISGQRARAVGVRYECTIPEGRKGSCIEEVVEHVPGERTATAFPEDTWGMSKMFADFVVETILVPQCEDETVLVLEAYYSILKFFSLAIRAALIFQVLHSIGATHNHGVAFG